MPSAFTFKAVNALHKALVTVTFGKVGWNAGAMKVVELTTTGRKSGQPRSVMLTSPVQEGDTWVIVASAGGEDRHPAWLLNVRDHPEVEVRLQGKPKRPMHARIANAEERARLWPKVTSTYKGYGGYQEKTEREIPLVLLEPPG